MEMGKQKFWNMAKEYGAKTEAAKANIDTKAIRSRQHATSSQH